MKKQNTNYYKELQRILLYVANTEKGFFSLPITNKYERLKIVFFYLKYIFPNYTDMYSEIQTQKLVKGKIGKLQDIHNLMGSLKTYFEKVKGDESLFENEYNGLKQELVLKIDKLIGKNEIVFDVESLHALLGFQKAKDFKMYLSSTNVNIGTDILLMLRENVISEYTLKQKGYDEETICDIFLALLNSRLAQIKSPTTIELNTLGKEKLKKKAENQKQKVGQKIQSQTGQTIFNISGNLINANNKLDVEKEPKQEKGEEKKTEEPPPSMTGEFNLSIFDIIKAKIPFKIYKRTLGPVILILILILIGGSGMRIGYGKISVLDTKPSPGTTVEETCAIPNGKGKLNALGKCKVTECDEGFHTKNEDSTCEKNTKSCGIQNGIGNQIWLDGTWSECIREECYDGFHGEGNDCIGNTKNCEKIDGKGLMSFTNNARSECLLQSCNNGYLLVDGVCKSKYPECSEPDIQIGDIFVASCDSTINAKMENGNGYYSYTGSLKACEPGYHLPLKEEWEKILSSGTGSDQYGDLKEMLHLGTNGTQYDGESIIEDGNRVGFYSIFGLFKDYGIELTYAIAFFDDKKNGKSGKIYDKFPTNIYKSVRCFKDRK